MDEEELRAKIEELRAVRGNRQAEEERECRESRFLGETRQRREGRSPEEARRHWENRSPEEGRQRGYSLEEARQRRREAERAFTRDEPEEREEGVLGVLAFQGIVALGVAILYVLASTFFPQIAAAAAGEVRERSASDFSFRDQVYETVGNFLTRLNEIAPVDGSLSPEDSASSEGDPSESSLTGIGGERTPADALSLPENVTYAPLIFTGRITFPLAGEEWRTTSGFGFREHPGGGGTEFHTALDLAAPKGTPILAAADGVAVISEESGSLGRHIVLDHGSGFFTVYGHCDRLLAKEGARVREGEIIARVGSTGDSTGYHLHFGMRKDGLYFDPAEIFPQAGTS